MEYDRGSASGPERIRRRRSRRVWGAPPDRSPPGFLIGLLESLGAGLISSGYKDAIALFVLLLVLWIKPSGLFGSREESDLKKF